MTTSYREIPLIGKRGAGKVALVDEADYAYLSRFAWYYHVAKSSRPGHEGYAVRYVRHRAIYMHVDIMQPPPGMEVDHRRIGSGLDNRRVNLRVVPAWVNQQNRGMPSNNTSGHLGVRPTSEGRWRTTIEVQGTVHSLGTFATAEEAAAAYIYARQAVERMIAGETDVPLKPPAAPPAIGVPHRRDNTSGYAGVTWDKANHRWMARLGLNGKTFHLGRFRTREDAAAAYQAAYERFVRHHGTDLPGV